MQITDDLIEHTAVVLYSFEMDWPDITSQVAARRALTCPEATGDHSGDCTGECHTCLRCERDRMFKIAKSVLEEISKWGEL